MGTLFLTVVSVTLLSIKILQKRIFFLHEIYKFEQDFLKNEKDLSISIPDLNLLAFIFE